jgi:hypothetical protein
MKKLIILSLAATMMLSSCATIFGGRISDCQKTKPPAGQPSRDIRIAALILDIVIFWPGAVVDFADYAIYSPCYDRRDIRMEPKH